jgi:hypothetical protein
MDFQSTRLNCSKDSSYGRGNIVGRVGDGPRSGYDPLFLMSFFDCLQRGQ